MTAGRVGGAASVHGSIAAAEELTNRERRVVGPMEFHFEPGERLLTRLDQIDALLCAATGEGIGPFRRMNDAAQEAYLQTICDLVSAARVDAWVVTHDELRRCSFAGVDADVAPQPRRSALDNGAC